MGAELVSCGAFIAHLYYEGEGQPLRNMHVYIDLPDERGFYLYHARTSETGKLCSVRPEDPEGPVQNAPHAFPDGCRRLPNPELDERVRPHGVSPTYRRGGRPQ